MTSYLAIIEKSTTGFSAFFPDLPGCIATGATREEVDRNMREAIAFHVEGLRLERYDVPAPRTSYAIVDV